MDSQHTRPGGRRPWLAVVLVVLVLLGSATACGDSDSEDPESATTIANATPDLIELTHWAFSRFDQAGLERPTVARIDFDPEVPQCVPGATAWALIRETGNQVLVCLRSEQMCETVNGHVFTNAGKLCLLHELAHIWLEERVRDDVKQSFMDSRGLGAWGDPSLRWHERGAEVAAETLAWGLMDIELAMVRIDRPPCSQLTEGFELLTGVSPLIECVDGPP